MKNNTRNASNGCRTLFFTDLLIEALEWLLKLQLINKLVNPPFGGQRHNGANVFNSPWRTHLGGNQAAKQGMTAAG